VKTVLSELGDSHVVGCLEAFRLDGQVAMVCGGGGGIGSGISAVLAEAGATVALVQRSRERAEDVLSSIRRAGGHGLAIQADVTDREATQAAVTEIVSNLGGLDIIVNAVGGGAGDALYPAHDYPAHAWDRILRLNLVSTLIPTQAAVRAMISSGREGRVLNISSVRGQLGINAGYSAYVAAKGAINSLTRQWAVEWAKYNIRVNAIAPTFVETPQVASLLADAKFKEVLLSRIPLGRIGTTEDLVGAVLFFCSKASAFVTGQILTIDGGLTAAQ
jgi:NAD(P)-dependent dehydrogenase (short-subunit alcohol dehydrogenase family)